MKNLLQVYTFFSDPGHAWLQVPMAIIKQLKLSRMITPWSYKHNGFAYLEEDSDAGKFLDAWCQATNKTKEVFFKEYCIERYEENTSIRGYNPFC